MGTNADKLVNHPIRKVVPAYGEPEQAGFVEFMRVEDALEYEAAVKYTGYPKTKEADWAHQIVVLMEQGLLPHHKLLEVGAGAMGVGRMVIKYLSPGHYWAVEPNDWLCKASKVPRHSYRLYTFDDFKLTKIIATFDYVFAHSVITHADRKMVGTLMCEAYLVLRPRGMFIATFYDPGCGDSTHEGWLCPAGCSYTTAFITTMAEGAGFEVETIRDTRHPLNHTWLFARKI